MMNSLFRLCHSVLGSLTRKQLTFQLNTSQAQHLRALEALYTSQRFLLDQHCYTTTVENVFINLTSYGERIDTVHFTILSLLLQTCQCDKVYLWLCEQELERAKKNKCLMALMPYGLEIKICQDLRSYKKLIPALELHPSSTHITCDDDIIYPATHIEQLIMQASNFPGCVVCHRAHNIAFSIQGDVLPYSQWRKDIEVNTPSKLAFPIGMGGVLYPANALDPLVNNEALFTQLCPTADDFWFKVMSLKQGVSVVTVNKPIKYSQYLQLPAAFTSGLWQENKYNNDKQLANLLQEFKLLKSELAHLYLSEG